ncbi:MAG: Unknown protein [uncultured Campylobacterales bacterium]|uniref:Uncharacterized protein n=1 Tax=uncultured Campylobacterales bacterium TaxID=352960 RepID=A0A6S6S2G8_9BACT|nr:MAG: Unknown protein [uncultured Campylobacterales bacterium]
MQDKYERYQTQKQTRLLKSFILKSQKILNHPELDTQNLIRYTKKPIDQIQKFPELKIPNQALNELRDLALFITNQIQNNKDVDEIRSKVFYQINQYEKSRNSTKYKKTKHKNNFEDY